MKKDILFLFSLDNSKLNYYTFLNFTLLVLILLINELFIGLSFIFILIFLVIGVICGLILLLTIILLYMVDKIKILRYKRE